MSDRDRRFAPDDQRLLRVARYAAAVLLGAVIGLILLTNAQRTSRTSTEVILVDLRPDGVWIMDERVGPPAEGESGASRRRIVLELDTERYRRGVGFASHVWLTAGTRDDLWLRITEGDQPWIQGENWKPEREDLSSNMIAVLLRRSPRHPHVEPHAGLEDDPRLQHALAAVGAWYDARPDPLGTRGLGSLLAQGGGTRVGAPPWASALWIVGVLMAAACGLVAMGMLWIVERALE